MFGDDDPDIAPFFAKFLGEGPPARKPRPRRDGRIRESRYAADNAPMTNGLALGLAGAADLLEAGGAPKVRIRSERTEAFHQLLEDMANGIMTENEFKRIKETFYDGDEGSPRSSASETPRLYVAPVRVYEPAEYEPAESDPDEYEPAERAERAEPLPHSYSPLYSKIVPTIVIPPKQPDEEEDEEASDESSEEEESEASDAVDVPNLANLCADAGYPRIKPIDFGATLPPDVTPPNHMRVSVVLKSGKCIMDSMDVDLDSSLEDMFDRIETKSGKEISTLVTRNGVTLERSDLPIKWSGLQDGDSITAVPQKPAFEVVKASAASLDSLAAARFKTKFGNSEAVSMGGFGDTIATAQASGAYPSTHATPSKQARPSAVQDRDSEVVEQASFDYPPDSWSASAIGELGLTALIQQGGINFGMAPPVPPSADASSSFQQVKAAPLPTPPTPPVCMPDEFEDLPDDAFITPHMPMADAIGEALVSPSKPRLPRKAAESPPPPGIAGGGSLFQAAMGANSNLGSTPNSSRLSDLSFAPTPSRKSQSGSSTQGQSRADAEELKRKMSEKQKQNDAIWANIASTLEPAQLETTKRGFMSQTGGLSSAGSLKDRMKPLAASSLKDKMTPLARRR